MSKTIKEMNVFYKFKRDEEEKGTQITENLGK